MRRPNSLDVTILAIAFLIGAFTLTGCKSAGQDLKDLTGFGMPSPSEAASWMFHRDAERRRLGITLIANADFGGQPVYLEVYQQAVTDVDPLVRAAAAQALGLHGTGADAELVAPLLVDHFHLTRWEAATALQRLHNPVVVPALIAALANDEEKDVRRASAVALGQYKEGRVVEALIDGLDDRSLTVNQHAKRALYTLTGQDLGMDSRDWSEWYTSHTMTTFADGVEYLYPVYSRKRTWYEKVTPFGAQKFESPGKPAEMVAVDATAEEDLLEPVHVIEPEDK